MTGIRRAAPAELREVIPLALLLWPGHPASELAEEFAKLLSADDAAIFLAFQEDMPIGFAQCQLRHDYVEGTTSSPVGYLEGIYVAEGCRHQGVARTLLAACESWAHSQGCREFASDCELDNTQGLLFHRSVGFREANRIICFSRKLGDSHGLEGTKDPSAAGQGGIGSG